MTVSKPIAAALALALSATVGAQTLPKGVDVSADVRLRLEEDWDSRTAAGVERPERTRARIRIRAAGSVDLGGDVKVFARVRTDSPGSQQNANITFRDWDGNPTDDFHLVEDRYSVAYGTKTTTIEVGRMAFPFLTTNEYFWDGDIDPLGAGGGHTFAVAPGTTLRLNAGAFTLPVGLAHFSGRLFGAQAVGVRGPATLAAGLFRFEADRGNPRRLRLLDGNGSRDYSVLAINALYRIPAGGKPLLLGADLYRNLQGYARSPDAFARANDGQRTGYVLSAAWGDIAAKRHVQLGYRWSHMEQLAVNASYAHDDLARFGNAQQSALTNLKATISTPITRSPVR